MSPSSARAEPSGRNCSTCWPAAASPSAPCGCSVRNAPPAPPRSFAAKPSPSSCSPRTPSTGVDLALFSAGAGISRRFAPAAVRAGAVVVDNSSAFRHGRRRAAGRPGDQRRGRRLAPGHHREPELHHRHHADGSGSVAPRLRGETGFRLQLPGGFRQRREGDRGVALAGPGHRRRAGPGRRRFTRTPSPSTSCRTWIPSWKTATPRRR